MTDLHALLDEVREAGVTLETDGEKLSATPAGVLPELLKNRLRQRKPDIIRLLAAADLSAGAARLQAADIRVAVFITETDAGLTVTGGDGLVQGETAAREAWSEGATVFDANEMLCYVQLSPAERNLFRELKTIRPGQECPKLSGTANND